MRSPVEAGLVDSTELGTGESSSSVARLAQKSSRSESCFYRVPATSPSLDSRAETYPLRVTSIVGLSNADRPSCSIVHSQRAKASSSPPGSPPATAGRQPGTVRRRQRRTARERATGSGGLPPDPEAGAHPRAERGGTTRGAVAAPVQPSSRLSKTNRADPQNGGDRPSAARITVPVGPSSSQFSEVNRGS
jgi:hypothetical protein